MAKSKDSGVRKPKTKKKKTVRNAEKARKRRPSKPASASTSGSDDAVSSAKPRTKQGAGKRTSAPACASTSGGDAMLAASGYLVAARQLLETAADDAIWTST
jgi:hypothetical protein